MLKLLLGGVWMCVVTAGAALTAPIWLDPPSEQEQDFIEGLDYIKTRAMNVPIIRDGEITGYVIARFVYTGDARTLNALSVPPTVYVLDEALQTIYADETINFTKLRRQDLSSLTETIRAKVNERLRSEIVRDILIDRFDYISAEQMAQFAEQQ